MEAMWSAARHFGPEIRGTLDVRKDEAGWMARIAGFSAPVGFDENRVSFEIAGDRSRFRGRLDLSAGLIRGHWIQPPTAANRVRFASPVDLRRREDGSWRGEVTPLDDTMTFFLSLSRGPDGSLGGFLRNPEANFGRHFDIVDVALDGSALSLIERDRGQVRLRGTYGVPRAADRSPTANNGD